MSRLYLLTILSQARWSPSRHSRTRSSSSATLADFSAGGENGSMAASVSGISISGPASTGRNSHSGIPADSMRISTVPGAPNRGASPDDNDKGPKFFMFSIPQYNKVSATAGGRRSARPVHARDHDRRGEMRQAEQPPFLKDAAMEWRSDSERDQTVKQHVLGYQTDGRHTDQLCAAIRQSGRPQPQRLRDDFQNTGAHQQHSQNRQKAGDL